MMSFFKTPIDPSKTMAGRMYRIQVYALYTEIKKDSKSKVISSFELLSNELELN